MFQFLKRKKKPKSLGAYLRETKQIIVNDVLFEIKRVNVVSFLEGYSVLTSNYALLDDKRKKEDTAKLTKQLNTYYRDVIMASVTRPKLSFKPDVDGTHHIDLILSDASLRDGLVTEILAFSKKK